MKSFNISVKIVAFVSLFVTGSLVVFAPGLFNKKNATTPHRFHKQGFKGSITCGQVIQGNTSEGDENTNGNNLKKHFYSFQVGSKGVITFDSCQADFDAYLTVYDVKTGKQIASKNDDVSCGQQSRVTDEFSTGNYYIMIDGYKSSLSGNYNLAMHCASENIQTSRSQIESFSIDKVEDTIECGKTIQGNTENGTDTISNPNISPEHFFSFSITHETTVTFNSCDSEFDTYIAVFDNVLNKLAFNDDGDCGAKSVLSINLEVGEYYLMIEGYYYYAGPYSIEMGCEYSPSMVSSKVPTMEPSIIGFPKHGDMGSVECGQTVNGNTKGHISTEHFFTFSLLVPTKVTLNACGSKFDTVLRVYEANTGEEVAYNDDSNMEPCFFQSSLRVELSAGKYYAMIEGFAGTFGEYEMIMSCDSIMSTYPSIQPSRLTSEPSMIPSSEFSPAPSTNPTFQPSLVLTIEPSILPTRSHSEASSVNPTIQASKLTTEPSIFPTRSPIERPSFHPTILPSQPTTEPSVRLTSRPSEGPSERTTLPPSQLRTNKPNKLLSNIPSERPSKHPTVQPSDLTNEQSMIPTSTTIEGSSMYQTFQPSQLTNRPSTTPSSPPSKGLSIQFPQQNIEGSVKCGETVTGTTKREQHFYGHPSPEHFFTFSLLVPTNVTLSACGSKFDTVLRVYEANTGKEVAYNDDSNMELCFFQSSLRIELSVGRYYAMIEGYERASGEYEMIMSCDSIYMTPTVFPSTYPSIQPSRITSKPSMVPSSEFSQAPSMEFPRQGIEGSIKCDQTILGQTNDAADNYGEDSNEHFYAFSLNTRDRIQFDSCNSDFDTIIRIYDAKTHDEVAFNDDSNSCGSQANITMSLARGDYYVLIEGFGNNVGSYELNMKCQIDNNIPAYVQGTIECNQNVVGNTANGTNQYGNPSPEHFYQFSVLKRQHVMFQACESDFDTFITIYDENENQVAYNDDDCGLKSVLDIDLEQGTYYLLVEGYQMSFGNYSITMKCSPYATTSHPSQATMTKVPDLISSTMPTSTPSIYSSYKPSFENASISPSVSPTYQSSLNHSLEPSPIPRSKLSSVPITMPTPSPLIHPSDKPSGTSSVPPSKVSTYQPSQNHSMKPSPIPSSKP